MSTLTHARLAPISQRYLATWRERFTLPIKPSEASKQDDMDGVSPTTKQEPRRSRENNTPRKSYRTLMLTNGAQMDLEREVLVYPRTYSRMLCDDAASSVRWPKVTGCSNNSGSYVRAVTHKCHDEEEKRREHYHDQNHHVKSLFAMLGIIGMFKRSSPDDVEEERLRLSDKNRTEKMKPIELKVAKGVLAMCDQDYRKANILFHEALHIAQEENDEEQENLILNLIGANFFEGGEYEKAEKLFIDLMKRMIANDMSPTAPAILELSLKLASIYAKNPATYEKAFKGFKFVIGSLMQRLDDVLSNLGHIDIQELSEEKRDELALLGWSYDWFAKHLLNSNDYTGAADMLQRAMEISSKVLGELHDQTLILSNDIGTTMAMNNAPEEGRMFIKKAVQGAIQSQSNELASFYVNLGLVNLKLRKLHEAKRYCEYSMELASKNREHHNSYEVTELSRTCLNEVGRLLEAEGQ